MYSEFLKEPDTIENAMNKEQRYNKWKSDYLLRHKREKKIYLLKLCVGVIVLALLYCWYTDRLTFFAQPTDLTKGIVTKTQPRRISPKAGMMSYIQNATYSYEIKGKLYEEDFYPTKSIGRLHEGDTLNVQYSLFFNGLSKVVKVHHCPHNN